MMETRLKQLVIDETEAWKASCRTGGAVIAGIVLVNIGVGIAGTLLGSHVPSPRQAGLAVTGMLMQGIGGMLVMVYIIPCLLCFARWIGAMWRRRRFCPQ